MSLLFLISFSARTQTLQQSLDATNFTWTTSGTGGSSGWIAQTNFSQDGVSSARTTFAYMAPGVQTATLQTTVTGPGTLMFWWYGAFPDSDGSKLVFFTGTTPQVTNANPSAWNQQTIYVGSGSQTLKWVYTLPANAPGNYPGYVDQVTWTTGRTAPILTAPPPSQSVIPGLNATFYTEAVGTPPLNFQWQFHGTNLPGATGPSFTITNASTTNLGPYQVIVSNSTGTNTSNEASLEFGHLAVWGYNSSADARGIAPPGATNLLQISGGWRHNELLRSDGTVCSWGATNVVPAGIMETSSNALYVAALNGGSVVLNDDGTVRASGSSGITNIPPELSNVVTLAQGPTANACLALKLDGKVVGWGDNSYLVTVPSDVSNVVSVAASHSHCVALLSDGRLARWGNNPYARPTPSQLFSNGRKVIAIAGGAYHNLALRSDGVVFAWGYNAFGQTNVPAAAQSGVIAIAAGQYHSLALRADGTVVAWGYNFFGQSTVPSGLSNVVAIAAGGYHSMAMIADGPPSTGVISTPAFSSNSFRLTIPSQSGRIFELSYKNSLDETNWTALPAVAGNGSDLLLSDVTATNVQRIYRVRRW